MGAPIQALIRRRVVGTARAFAHERGLKESCRLDSSWQYPAPLHRRFVSTSFRRSGGEPGQQRQRLLPSASESAAASNGRRKGPGQRLSSTYLSPNWFNAVTLIVSIPAMSTAEAYAPASSATLLADKDEPAETASQQLVLLGKQRSSRNKERRSLLRRILRWIQNAYQLLREMLYITARGSQIVLHLSPTALLWPTEHVLRRGAALWMRFTTGSSSSSTGSNDGPVLCYDWTWSYARWSITQLGPAATCFPARYATNYPSCKIEVFPMLDIIRSPLVATNSVTTFGTIWSSFPTSC
jgi:hypothetical protein